MRHSTTKNKIIDSTFFLLALFILLIAWLITAHHYQNELMFPKLSQIFLAFINIFKNGTALKAIGFTILRVIISVAICFLIGFIIMSLYIIWPISLAFFRPFISIMRSMPLAIISLFIFILIGDRLGPYLITILMSLPVTIEGLIVATDEINQGIIDEVKTLKGSIFQKIIHIYLPIIMPYLLMCLIQTLGMSFKVMIMGEYICQSADSIGKTLYGIKSSLAMDELIAYGILIIIISFLFEFFVNLLKQANNKKSNI